MNPVSGYFDYVKDVLAQVQESQKENIEAAAKLIADSVLGGKCFYAFGSGHSHIIAEEIYGRAGGLACVRPILPTELMVFEFPTKSTFIERLSGYSAGLIDQYKVQAGDTMLIISNSGRNAVPVEMAEEAKKRGAKVIALTSLQHSRSAGSRAPSGRRLYELADVVIDNFAPAGDAGFMVEGVRWPMGPVSDITGIAVAEAMMAQTARLLAQAGMEPPVFISSNVDGDEDHNARLFEEYYGFVREKR